MAARVNQDDPRVKRTRKSLQAAFLELLAQKDFDSITIQDIADRAGMNRATFYTHYQDKYELLDLILDEMFAAIVAKWTPADLNIDDEILVRHFLRVVCEWQVEIEKRINSRMTLSSAIAENARKQLHTITARCLKQAPHRLPADQRRLEIIASMAGWSIYGIVLEWRQYRDRETVDQLIEHATPFVLSILQSLKPIEKNTGWLELTGPATPTFTTAARG